MNRLEQWVDAVEDFFIEAEEQLEMWWEQFFATFTQNTNDNTVALTVTTVILLLLTSLMLFVVMAWRRPQRWLDRALLGREVMFSVLWLASLLGFYWGLITARHSIIIYALLIVVNLAVMLFLVRENTDNGDG